MTLVTDNKKVQPAGHRLLEDVTGVPRYVRRTAEIYGPVTFQCWPSVVDAGPALKRHWAINFIETALGQRPAIAGGALPQSQT